MKNLIPSRKIWHRAALMVTAGMLGVAAAPAQAVDLYVGAGLGQSNADFDNLNNSIAELDHKNTAWKLFTGGRVLWLGAELAYTDFGKPADTDSEVHYKGFSAFGLLYAPIPVPFLDLYAKAGLANLKANVRNVATTFNTDDTKFAYGLGAQVKVASFAIRGEYEKFKLDSAKPSLISLSAVYVLN